MNINAATASAVVAQTRTPAADKSLTLPIVSFLLGLTKSQRLSTAELMISAKNTKVIANKTAIHSKVEILK